MKRRYTPIGLHPTYDRMFDVCKGDSPVLNPHGIPGAYSLNLGDESTLKSLLLEYQGDPNLADGFFLKGESGGKTASHLKAAELRIQEIETEFQQEKQTNINQGKHPPKKMSKRLQEKLLQAEARLDVIEGEIEVLEKLLKNFTDAGEKSSNKKVLQRGPQGMGKLSGGTLSVVDGQIVKPDKDGVLRIADERSQYHGMKTADYFSEIVKPWLTANAKLMREHQKKLQEKEITDTTSKAPKAPWPEYSKEQAEAA